MAASVKGVRLASQRSGRAKKRKKPLKHELNVQLKQRQNPSPEANKATNSAIGKLRDLYIICKMGRWLMEFL